jgi:hypothetical protein
VQAFVCWIPGCLVFFRTTLWSGFDRIGGDSGDGRLIVALHEHWIDVFRGHTSWASPNFFYPTKGTLGYTDTFLLNEVFYAPLRAVGLDPFVAYQWTIVAMSLVGFVAFFVICRRGLEMRMPAAFALSTAFTFANNLNVVALHAQLYSVYWLPLLGLGVLAAVRAMNRRLQAVWGATAGLLWGLILFSTYYIGWFAALGAVVFVIVFVPFQIRLIGFRRCIAFVSGRWTAMTAFVVGSLFGLVPFVMVYLPVLRSVGGRSYDDAMFYAATPRDILNLGESNYLWGSFVRSHVAAARLANGEVSVAVTPVLLILALASVMTALRMWKLRGSEMLTRLCVAAGVTALLLTILPVRTGAGSLWRIVWTLMPGASGIRAIDRLQIVAAPMFVITAALGIAIAYRAMHDGPRRVRALTVGIGLILLLVAAEQLDFGNYSRIDRAAENSNLSSAPRPPSICRLFYIVDRSTPSPPAYVPSIDAMLLAEQFDIPTINGYSGQFPDGYLPRDPADPAYLDQVNAWVGNFHLEDGLCSYDPSLRQWSPTP